MPRSNVPTASDGTEKFCVNAPDVEVNVATLELKHADDAETEALTQLVHVAYVPLKSGLLRSSYQQLKAAQYKTGAQVEWLVVWCASAG